jgi:putative two-component system response regulator
LTSRRVYKEAMPHEQALAIMLEGRGKHFDPDVIDAFLEVTDEFKVISFRHRD